MPKLGGGGGDESSGVMVDDRGGEHVEISMAIAAKDHDPGAKVLHKKTKRVKLYRARIIFGKVANRDKTSDDMRRNKNISKTEIMGGKSSRSRCGDGKMLPIANKDTRWYML